MCFLEELSFFWAVILPTHTGKHLLLMLHLLALSSMTPDFIPGRRPQQVVLKAWRWGWGVGCGRGECSSGDREEVWKARPTSGAGQLSAPNSRARRELRQALG